MEFARVSSQTYLETLNSNMYGIDGRLSNSTKKSKEITNRKKWKPNSKEQRMFVSGNRKSNR
jgi:RNase P/RNase MRP subunit p29